ncbi:MAG: hydroxymethylpyrimidine/phosphomethylpyrimidine kinase [Nocardioidaceae bacterium]|nr:hydroxymethylpyrimidine/phosphomethylpyrimidine kinase [Nocardioidaceae bacterium]
MTPPVVLTIAGTDSGGAAGIAADLTTFAALGVHGASVVTAVTAQDTAGVRATHPVPYDVVAAQLDAVLEDLDPVAIKTGMLATPAIVRLVAQRCSKPILVVDPVVVATSGAVLAGPDVVSAYRTHLIPVATVVTPNPDEYDLLDIGSETTVIRTGSGAGDIVQGPGVPPLSLPHQYVATTNDHGTGCTHSAALAAYLARGLDLAQAATAAAAYVRGQLRMSKDWRLGRGRGPLAHISTTSPATSSITTAISKGEPQ